MGRVKQTARKGSGGWPARSSRRRLPPPEVREPLKRDERPTGQEYLDAVSSIRVQRQGQDSTDASLGREEGIATQPCSIADARNALPALSPELLQQVFEKLGAHPKDLVPLAAVCKQWRAVLKNYTWRELCLDYAGGLVEELGYDGGQEEPPGGFEGLYKLVTYCPGFHFPTSDYVLRASAIYSWRYGLGHLEMSPKCFLTGDDARAALFLAPCFAKDEFSVSHLCCHDQAIDQSAEYSPPPLYACRGIVKDFKSSELARACGAAAHLQQRQSDLEGARDKEALPCPYCEELVFPLKPEDIPHAYTCYETLYLDCVEAVHPDCREDSLSAYNSVSDSEAESEPEIKVEPERVLVSGFACLAGHIVLQVAGYPGRHPGTQIEDSGEMLRLGSSNAVAFLTEHAAENGILRYKEGQSLVDELEFDQLIKVADRLEELEDEWPSFVASARPYIRVAGVYPWRPISENPSLSKEMLRGSGLPHKVADGLYDYVLRGEPDLAHCMELLFEAVEAQVQEYLLRERREEVLVALQEAGFERSSITHEESVDKYVQDPDAITLEEVLSQQKLASDKEEFKRKELEREALEWSKDPSCGVAMDGKVCQNTRAKACSNKACYICCQKLSNKCFYHRT